MKRVLLGSLLLAGLAGFGCEAEVHPEPVVVGAEYDVGPDVVYYDRGHYDGGYWVWNDRGGHSFREERRVHEERAARIHHGGEHHEEHHEEHR